ncbi:MAG: hypothetical protein Q4P33_04250 [Flaviflexus sp.]|nr:hypothetical protein [Flaviflexus sp.]
MNGSQVPIRREPRSDGIVLDPSDVLLWTPRRPERIGSWSFASPRSLHIGQGVDLVAPRPTTGRSFPASCYARAANPRAVELAAYEIDAELGSLLSRLTAHLPAITILTNEVDPASAAARAFSRGARVVFIVPGPHTIRTLNQSTDTTGTSPSARTGENDGDSAEKSTLRGEEHNRSSSAPSHIFGSESAAEEAEQGSPTSTDPDPAGDAEVR